MPSQPLEEQWDRCRERGVTWMALLREYFQRNLYQPIALPHERADLNNWRFQRQDRQVYIGLFQHYETVRRIFPRALNALYDETRIMFGDELGFTILTNPDHGLLIIDEIDMSESTDRQPGVYDVWPDLVVERWQDLYAERGRGLSSLNAIMFMDMHYVGNARRPYTETRNVIEYISQHSPWVINDVVELRNTFRNFQALAGTPIGFLVLRLLCGYANFFARRNEFSLVDTVKTLRSIHLNRRMYEMLWGVDAVIDMFFTLEDVNPPLGTWFNRPAPGSPRDQANFDPDEPSQLSDVERIAPSLLEDPTPETSRTSTPSEVEPTTTMRTPTPNRLPHHGGTPRPHTPTSSLRTSEAIGTLSGTTARPTSLFANPDTIAGIEASTAAQPPCCGPRCCGNLWQKLCPCLGREGQASLR